MIRVLPRRRFAALLPFLAALLLIAPARAQELSVSAQEVFRLVNEERARAGLRPLVRAPELDRAAQKHSQSMADADFFSHTGLDGSSPGDRVRREGYDPFWWGENIAAGYPTPPAVMDGWMNSPGHRANILNANFSEIGIGVAVRAGSSYYIYWTQDFGTRPGGPPPPPAGDPPPGSPPPSAGNGVPRPALIGLVPSSGRPGDSVILVGSGFGSAGTVTFPGGLTARAIVWTADRVVVEVPAGAVTGDVYLQNSAGTSNGARFEVLLPPPPPDNRAGPQIDAITPSAASPNTLVTLTGRNFTSFRGSVTFNGALALVIMSWSGERIDLLVPPGATSGPVVVTSTTGSSAGVPFAVTNGSPPPSGPAAPPQLVALASTSATAGVPVGVIGSNLGSAPGTVRVDRGWVKVESWGDRFLLLSFYGAPGVRTFSIQRWDGRPSNELPFELVQ